MEKEHRTHLQRLRLLLLENISDYKGITDGLFAEGIITPAMKERIFLKKGSDQLREILDILPKRGDKAFHTFYKVLVQCGEDTAADLLCPELAAQRKSNASSVQTSMQPLAPLALPEEDELPAKWPDKDSHDPFRVDVVTVPETHTAMKAMFNRAVDGAESVYSMHKPVRGIFLLISNQFFKEARKNGEDLEDRDGTGKDVMALSNLFRQLHFRVETKMNLTADEMLEAVVNHTAKVQATDNCFACAVLTHGERGVVFGTDGKKLPLDDLKAAVADNCHVLIGKPKIFFIQACQGNRYDSGVTPLASGQGDAPPSTKPADENEEIKDLAQKFVGFKLRDQSDASKDTVSSKSDIFVAMATIADFVSWRNTNWGTWFVQAVVYIFSRFAHKYEINQLMTRVNKLVSRAETTKGFKQVSVYDSSLTSDFYFFPGLQQQGVMESHSETDLTKNTSQSQQTPPQQSASLQPAAPSLAMQPSEESSSVTAQASDDLDGGRSVLVE